MNQEAGLALVLCLLVQKTHLLAPLQLLSLIFLLNLNPHASPPTRPADTFLCGWAHTQTKLLRSAMWKIPSTEVKRNPETEASSESGSATQFSREAGDPVTSSQNSFNRETVDIRAEDLEICRRETRNRNVPWKQLLYILFQKVVCLLPAGLDIKLSSFFSSRCIFSCAVCNRQVSRVLAEEQNQVDVRWEWRWVLLRRWGTINASSSSSKDRKNNTAHEDLSKLNRIQLPFRTRPKQTVPPPPPLPPAFEKRAAHLAKQLCS